MSQPQIRVKISSLYEDLKKSRKELENNPSAVKNSRSIVEKALKDGSTHYGINTGFGALANKRV